MVVHRPVVPLALVLFLLVALAGCLGGDAPPSDNGGTNSTPTGNTGGGGGGGGNSGSGTGSVAGIVLDDGFSPVHGANVQLRQDGSTIAHTSTGAGGLFEFTEIPTGSYRLEATAACCRDATERITVQADSTTQRDLVLERRSETDLQRPFVVHKEWEGFLGCGFSLFEAKGAPCTMDENHDPEYRWNVTQGLRTLYVYLEWEPQTLGEQLFMEVTTQTDFEYGQMEGESALHLRIDNDEIEDPTMRFEHIEGQLELFLNVLPGGDIGVVYQQEFHVTILEFHWRHAPEGFEFSLPE